MIRIPVFLSSDDNYAPFVATTIASICDNTQSFIDFYVLDGGISSEKQEKICELKSKFSNFSIEFIKVDVDKEFAAIEYYNQGSWITIQTYSRFLIPKLKPNIEKAIYLDVDIIAMVDIAEMYSEDLECYAVGGVWEEFNEGEKNIIRKEMLGLSNAHRYFNAGILLLNTKKWAEMDILSEVFKIEANFKNKLKYADQDVLNILFDNNAYKMIDKKFCWIQNKVLNQGVIGIRHFAGGEKPWQFPPMCNAELVINNHKDFWQYAKLTAFYSELCEEAMGIDEAEQILRKIRLDSALKNIKSRV